MVLNFIVIHLYLTYKPLVCVSDLKVTDPVVPGACYSS